MLGEFRSLGQIVSQSVEALERVVGQGNIVANLLLGARELIIEGMRADLTGLQLSTADPKLTEYLMASMGSLPEEVLRVLFVDQGHRLIADEQLQFGTLAQLVLYPRTIFRRAMEYNAAGLILVHNHPSGDPTPSEHDIAATQRLIEIGRSLDVEVIDHLIVTQSRWERVSLPADDKNVGRAPAGHFLRDSVGQTEVRTEAARQLALARAQRAVRRRMLRRQLVGRSELFGEPAWEMLLILFIHDCEGRRISASALGYASGLPRSSAMRLVQRLCDEGLAIKRDDLTDRRRHFVELAQDLSWKLFAYFSEDKDD